MSVDLAEYRDCPDCGTPVVRGPTLWRMARWLFSDVKLEPCPGIPCGPGWLEYTTTLPRVWAVHSSTRCAYVAAQPAGLRVTMFGERIRP